MYVQPNRQPTEGPCLLALDIDGTIVNDGGQLDQLTALATSIVTASGVRVVLATGRSPWSGIAEIARELGLHGPQISMQGALVVDPDGGEVHLARALPAALYLDALDLADELGLDPVVAIADGHRAERLPDWIGSLSATRAESRAFQYRDDLSRLVDEPPFRVYLPTEPGRHEAVRSRFSEELGSRATVMWTDTSGVEVLAPNVDKGIALGWMAGELGIPMGRVAAIGDARNDMGMLLRAGLSAAMAPAPEEVRQAATIVVPSVEQSGAVTALRCFFPHLIPEFDVMEAEAEHLLLHLPEVASVA